MVGNDVRYILDANIFIEAYKRYYAFDLCPGFWQSIVYYGTRGIVASIDRVQDQLQEGALLDQWKSGPAKALFLPTDSPNVLAAYKEIILWVDGQGHLNPAAKARFAKDVDAWLIAYVKAKDLTMVTHEKSAPYSKSGVKIPDVCDAFDIKCCNTFEMLRSLQIAYHWESPPEVQ